MDTPASNSPAESKVLKNPDFRWELSGYFSTTLDTIEREHPYLNQPPSVGRWNHAKKILSTTDGTIPNPIDLTMAYNAICAFLRGVAEERAQVRTIGNARPLVVEEYFGGSFAEFVDKFGKNHYLCVPYDIEESAEAIIRGEKITRYRAEVKVRIFELLVYDQSQTATIENALSAYGHEKVLLLLREDDQYLYEIFANKNDQINSTIAEIILRARDTIDWKNGGTPTRLTARVHPADSVAGRHHLRLVK